MGPEPGPNLRIKTPAIGTGLEGNLIQIATLTSP
jgi:hypothetical protein